MGGEVSFQALAMPYAPLGRVGLAQRRVITLALAGTAQRLAADVEGRLPMPPPLRRVSGIFRRKITLAGLAWRGLMTPGLRRICR